MKFLEIFGSKPGLVAPGGGRAAAPAQRGSATRPATKQPQPVRAPEPLTTAKRLRMAERPPSFTELLPWTRFDADSQLFVLRDGQNLGLMFELTPVPTEAQPDDYLRNQAYRIQEALQALPESETSPWVLQFFVSDDRNVVALVEQFKAYILQAHVEREKGESILNSDFTQAYIEELRQHLVNVSTPEGLFVDTQVTGQPWRGQLRRVRCCIYKRFGKAVQEPLEAREQLEQVSLTLMSTFSEAGIGARRCNGRDFYEWMLPFFNRQVPWASSPSDLIAKAPYPGDSAMAGGSEDQAPIADWDFAEHMNLSEPVSDPDFGVWEFDGIPVKALTLQNLRGQPGIGHFTAERKQGDEFFARFDRLPAGSMLSLTLVVDRQEKVERHVERIRDSSRAQTAIAQETFAECERVLGRMAQGDKLYPMTLTLFLTGSTRDELQASVAAVNAQLIPSGLRFIEHRHDLAPLDAFIRGLPMCFDPAFDSSYMRRSRLTFASHIAALLPLYGRARGTGRMGFWFWNRGGEPMVLDPLSRQDRKKNAHMLVLGPTGAGKSATLNYLCMLMMAIYRPRLVIADAGKSFALLMEYFRTKGMSTHSVQLSAEADVSLPPFVHALKLLDDEDVMTSYLAMERSQQPQPDGDDERLLDENFKKLAPEISLLDAKEPETDAASPKSRHAAGDEAEDDEDGTERRDLLGEMLISATMMITGGEEKEMERFTRADRYMVSVAIIRAAVKCRAEKRAQVVVHDVAIELLGMIRDANLSPSRRERAEEMGQSMMVFTQALRGKLFNRPGTDWPDVDVTLVEMGTLTQDGYGDALALAYTSLIDGVQARGERFQADDRPLIFLTDEGHLISTNELLGPKIAKGTKMWRKLNIWFWLATQNMRDFPDSMSRVLSMCEWWMLLTMDKSEIEEVSRFRSLTPEQRGLIESATKEPPKYTEGVMISSIGQYLFRNVPPSLPIALAMTEGHEKAARRRLMEEHGINEMQAAQMVASRLRGKRE